jgi:hypothetical protein
MRFQKLVRFHDEATKGDYGSDTGNEYSVDAGADKHGRDFYDEEGREEKGTGRECD